MRGREKEGGKQEPKVIRERNGAKEGEIHVGMEEQK
jgi:hypothetical protein